MDLHKEFCRLAGERRNLTNKLLAMIPEIERLKIWEREGYQSVVDYAQRIAGLGAEVVKRRLGMEKRLVDKPALRKAMETVGMYKVARVMSVATKENEKELAEFVKTASKSTINQFMKEQKCDYVEKLSIELDGEMQYLFLKLKKKYGDKLSNKEVLRRALAELVPDEEIGPGTKSEKEEAGRYVERDAVRAAVYETKGRCKMCHRPYEIIHHTERWSQVHNHKEIVPLCEIHHQMCHGGYVDEVMWRVRRRPTLQIADRKYSEIRQKIAAI